MKRLTKSRTDRQVSGVLGGIAEYFGIDSTILRVIFLILVFMGVGSPVLVYILLAIFMPEPGPNDNRTTTKRPGYYSSGTYRPGDRPRKEAKPVEKEKEEDDWSDF